MPFRTFRGAKIGARNVEKPPAHIAPESWRRKVLYPIVGAAFGLGAPSGLLVVRAMTSPLPLRDAVVDALSSDVVTFAYVGASTVIAFAVFGWLLGRTVDRLRATSITDPLTGLYNRRYFHERLSTELRRATRYGSHLALLLVDVDELKRINDRYGHEAGDVAIIAVSQAIEQTCRVTDVAARFGGDEFVVLAPGVQAEGALELAARLRASLRDLPMPAGQAPPGVSIGITDATLVGEPSAEKMYAAADAALYVAKKQGRDQAVVSQPTPTSSARTL